MKRLLDWTVRLASWVESRRHLPFAWGPNDCISSAASAVEAITGENPLGDLSWSGMREAARVLIENGGDVRTCVASRLGEPVAPSFAQRGDVVLLDAGFVQVPRCGDAMLAVCLGHVCAAPGAEGLCFYPLSAAVACWPIGR